MHMRMHMHTHICMHTHAPPGTAIKHAVEVDEDDDNEVHVHTCACTYVHMCMCMCIHQSCKVELNEALASADVLRAAGCSAFIESDEGLHHICTCAYYPKTIAQQVAQVFIMHCVA